MATYRLRYRGGGEHEFAVRHGIEAAQANRIYQAARIEPIATAAQPVLEYVKDVVREYYQVLLGTVSPPPGIIERLHCTLEQGQPALAIFAITAECAERERPAPSPHSEP